MGEISQTLTVISLLIYVMNIVLFSYHFFIDKDLMLRADKARRALTYAVFALLLLGIFGYIYAFIRAYDNLSIGVSLLVLSVFLTLLLQWVISQVFSVEDNAKQIAMLLLSYADTEEFNIGQNAILVHDLTDLLYYPLPFFERLPLIRNNLEYAALFMDIGKRDVPPTLLNKGGKLADEELARVRRHAERSVDVLSRIPAFSVISDAIKYHHERYDGNGQFGIAGKDIPLAARLIAVADTFVAITTARSYRATLSYDEAIMELRQVRGTQLDPELVDLFCEIPKEKVEACLGRSAK